jgi:hypothetical protein
MEEILGILLSRLTEKGLGPDQVLWLMRDVLHILKESGDCTTRIVNQRLTSLGWSEDVVDRFTLELFVSMLDRLGEYEMRRHTLQ